AVKPQIQEFQPSAPAPAPRQRFTYSDTQTSVQSEGKFNPAAPAFQPSNNQFSSSAGAALPSFVPELCPAPTNNAARQTFTSSASYPKPAQNPSVVSALSEERAVDTNSNTVVTTMSNISNASTFAASTPIRKDCDTVPFNPTSAFKEIPIPLPADLRNAIREIENLTPVLDMVGKPQKLVVNEFYLAKLPGREAYGRAQILHADDKQRRAFVFFVDYVAGASVSYDMICSFPAYESWFIPPPFMKKTLSS
uniref:Uncharacterized protein n=1 Tax=Panagrolaimus sp. JU765 TaxID=591449 RepID=A0AC34RNQ1_9BILA